MLPLIFHLPHASTHIPADVRGGITMSDAALAEELRIITDHHTDALFGGCAVAGDVVVASPVSRLVVDVERFAEDAAEPMSAVGMGAVYVRGHDGGQLRASLSDRAALMERYYVPHHQALERAVQAHVAQHGRAIILDCHSFPQFALPYEPVQNLHRPQVCIGTDDYHTPESLVGGLESAFLQAGYSVARDTPFAGALVPLSYYRRDARVNSVMIELRRDIYMDESSSALHADRSVVTAAIHAAVAEARRH